MNIHEKYMRAAIALASRAEGLTNPNPAVGAVIVKGGKIIAKGYHRSCGLPHAEADAIAKASGRAGGATLYVTLEPCDHFGRTPPCTDAILKSGIEKVVIGMKDPNPINNGRGIKKLNKYGIKTVVGVLEEDARSLNRPYIKFITEKKPYITVKVAESLDGKIATKRGDSRWITSWEARRYVHELRGRVDAVMVGVNTVLRDDPMLTARIRGAKQPIRIIVDSRLATPPDARVFSNIRRSPVMIATTLGCSSIKMKRYERKGAKILAVKSRSGKVDLADLFKKLGNIGIVHILVEGGGELVASLVEAELADRFLFFIAPKIIGGRQAKTAVEGVGVNKIDEAVRLKNVKVRKFAKDILVEAEVDRCSRV